MPSTAYSTFQSMRQDVRDLISAHYVLENQHHVPRETLGYFVRSAIVMLCAAWERYNEDLLLEVVDLSVAGAIDASVLPEEVRKTISGRIKRDKNELSPMLLVDSGWKGIWRAYASDEIDALNTPNRGKLNALFHSYFGLPEYSRFWTDEGRHHMNKFVADRGEIAHNGNRARAIDIEELRTYHEMVVSCVIEIDSNMGCEMGVRTNVGPTAWDRTYARDEDV